MVSESLVAGNPEMETDGGEGTSYQIIPIFYFLCSYSA